MLSSMNLIQDRYFDEIEFKAYIHPEEELRMVDFIMKQAMEYYDKDGDYNISFQELVGARAKNYNKEWLLVEKEKFDNEYDKDKDGQLYENEIETDYLKVTEAAC
uniref:EF-hand domain-containing protein n=1 Tax=Trichogramma kaykai TaxID=54128 RepID=A0ABD2WK88_9HYME